MSEAGGKLTLSKPYKGYFWDEGFRAATHRALKTRRQAIRRRLRRKIANEERQRLINELNDLALAETQWFDVEHRDTNLPLGEDGKPFVPQTARGKRHVPVAALPLDAQGRRRIPSPRDIVANAVFEKFLNKGNLPMGLAKLAAIYPEKYRTEALNIAKREPQVRRALNRVGHDVAIGWPAKNDEMIVLENFYATTVFHRPLME